MKFTFEFIIFIYDTHQHDIAPTLYALRGVKILFAQHYAIDELAVVWDALLSTRDAVRRQFPLVEYLVRCF